VKAGVIEPADILRLHLGHYTLPAKSRWPGEKVVVCAYLVRFGDQILLFDTGIGVGHAETEATFGPIHRKDLRSELRQVGVGLDQISVVVNCHLHLDHCGNNPLFPGVPIFVQQAELDALPTLDDSMPELIEFENVELEVHDGAADISTALRIIATPGHTPGHQSLVIDTTDGKILLAGQAVDFASDYARAQFGLDVEVDTDEELTPAPPLWLAELRHLDIRRALFAHDRLVWDGRQASSQLAWT
jgi:N-acyl homoserine lactone hydrolase